MNKRIRQLAEQAGLLPREIGPVVETRHMKKKEQDLEKFAELIVKECARLCEHESNDDEYDQYDMGQSVKAESIKTAIKEHFGVEE